MDGQNLTGHPRFPDSFSPVVEDWRERHVYGRVSQGAKTGDACVEFRDFHYRGVTVLQWLSYPLQRLSDGEREDPRALGDGMKASQLNWSTAKRSAFAFRTTICNKNCHSKVLLRTLLSLAKLRVRNEIETHRIAIWCKTKQTHGREQKARVWRF